MDMLTCTVLMMTVMVATSTSLVNAYPFYYAAGARQRKVDPFVALATTLRQQDQQQQQQLTGSELYDDNNPMMMTSLVNPYEEESEDGDDLWRLEQLQRQLGRAALMPFYANIRSTTTDQRWNDDVAVDDEPEPEQQVAYGIPVEVEDWYDDDAGQQQPEVVFVPRQEEEEEEEEVEQERQKQEAEVLLNTLAEYMLMYDSGIKLPPGGELTSKRAAAVPTKQQLQQQQPEVADAATTTGSPAMTSTDGQPPEVQRDQDGTPIGQKEFPMMRPATQRKQQLWAATTTTTNQKDLTSKRHAKIVTMEDRLTQELDSLKKTQKI